MYYHSLSCVSLSPSLSFYSPVPANGIFSLCFSSIPFCILLSKYASTKEKNVSGISKKMPAALLQWNYYYLSWPNAGFPPPLTYFPPFKTEVFLFFPSQHPFRESLKPPVVKCRIVNGEFLFALRNWMFYSSLSNSRCLKLCLCELAYIWSGIWSTWITSARSTSRCFVTH